MAIPFYYNPATNELELTADPSPLRDSLGERFGLNEISIARNTLSPTKSYTEDRIDMKPGGIVEPGVENYGTATMDDALHNIKKGDELGKAVKQIISKKNEVMGYQAFTDKDRYYISNTEKNAFQRIRQYADEFRSSMRGSLRKGITKFTAEAMFQDPDFKEFFKKYLNKGEGYVKDFKGNADKLSLDDLKKKMG